MGIKTVAEYVQFYVGLGMEGSISLSSFARNEKLVLKHKLENSNLPKEQVLHGLELLDDLLDEVSSSGEQAVIVKYAKT